MPEHFVLRIKCNNTSCTFRMNGCFQPLDCCESNSTRYCVSYCTLEQRKESSRSVCTRVTSHNSWRWHHHKVWQELFNHTAMFTRKSNCKNSALSVTACLNKQFHYSCTDNNINSISMNLSAIFWCMFAAYLRGKYIRVKVVEWLLPSIGHLESQCTCEDHRINCMPSIGHRENPSSLMWRPVID